MDDPVGTHLKPVSMGMAVVRWRSCTLATGRLQGHNHHDHHHYHHDDHHLAEVSTRTASSLVTELLASTSTTLLRLQSHTRQA